MKKPHVEGEDVDFSMASLARGDVTEVGREGGRKGGR